MILAWGGVTFLQGWLLPSLDKQGGLYVSYSFSLLSHFLHTTIAAREHSTMEESFGLWIEEGNFILYLVSRATCKVGLSCGGLFCADP